jgi:hypothetical protein
MNKTHLSKLYAGPARSKVKVTQKQEKMALSNRIIRLDWIRRGCVTANFPVV